MTNIKLPTVVNLRYDYYDVYIGRPSKWENPFRIGVDGNRKEVLRKYYNYFLKETNLFDDLEELSGKRLGCFCKPLDCHGDILRNQLLNKINLWRLNVK